MGSLRICTKFDTHENSEFFWFFNRYDMDVKQLMTFRPILVQNSVCLSEDRLLQFFWHSCFGLNCIEMPCSIQILCYWMPNIDVSNSILFLFAVRALQKKKSTIFSKITERYPTSDFSQKTDEWLLYKWVPLKRVWCV